MMGLAFGHMTNDMRSKLDGYRLSLEHRYGDPRVYAAQREEMAAEQAEVAYWQAKTREEALSAAYQKNREKIREDHKSRLAQFVRDKPPRYLETGPDDDETDQTAEPPPRAGPRPPKAARARSSASAR